MYAYLWGRGGRSYGGGPVSPSNEKCVVDRCPLPAASLVAGRCATVHLFYCTFLLLTAGWYCCM